MSEYVFIVLSEYSIIFLSALVKDSKLETINENLKDQQIAIIIIKIKNKIVFVLLYFTVLYRNKNKIGELPVTQKKIKNLGGSVFET